MIEGKPWECTWPNYGLSMCMVNHDYNGFIKNFEFEFISRYGTVDVESLNVKCEGQCPKGCDEKFKLKLGKSITKKSFEKMFKHGIKHPQHCFVVKYEGVIKNNG